MLPGVIAEFSVEAVTQALRGAAVASVEVVARFPASSARVARLRVAFQDGREPLIVIGKSASGAGLSAARRELRFYEQIAPLWASPAPELLGSWEEERGEDARLLLLIEDLETSGYALAREGLSLAQLEGVADTLVSLHSRFWEDLHEEILDLAHPALSVTQSAQAWPADVIAAHATAARDGTARFLAAASDELSPAERGLLAEVLDAWEGRFLARAAGARSITLIHADFHLLGNVFFAAERSRPCVIDWSELKPGLGPHDLAYCLLSAPTEDRPARDLSLLRHYWEGLLTAGVDDYGWELCRWDFQFSLITNLFQSVLQQSPTWFRKTATAVLELDCRDALRRPPPIS
jgi:hypothetical protein